MRPFTQQPMPICRRYITSSTLTLVTLTLLLATLFLCSIPSFTHARTITAALTGTSQQALQQYLRRDPGVGVVLDLSGQQLTTFTFAEVVTFFPQDYQSLNGFDLSNNTLTNNFPIFNAVNCPWCNTGPITYLNLRQNNIVAGSGTTILGSYALAGPTCDPTQVGNCPFTFGIGKSLNYLDLSLNPINALPPYFATTTFIAGSASQPAFLTTDKPSTFKCSSCGLTALPPNSFQMKFDTLDLSYNTFSNYLGMNWATNLGSNLVNNQFSIVTSFSMAHCALTKLPLNGLHFVATGGSGGASPDITSVIDFSYNNFNSANVTVNEPMLDFSQVKFLGTIVLSHSNIQIIKPLMFQGSKIGNLDLSWNNLTSNLDASSIQLYSVADAIAAGGATATVSNIGRLSLNDANITSLQSGNFAGVQAIVLDLSGNAFPTGSSWQKLAFSGLQAGTLLLNRCSMTTATLLSNNENPFTDANIVSLSMTNDGALSTSQYNIFNPLPNNWLTSKQARFSDTLQNLIIGDVLQVERAFFRINDSNTDVWENSKTLAIILYIPNTVTNIISPTGPIYNMLSGYVENQVEIPISPRPTFTLEIRGNGYKFTQASGTILTDGNGMEPEILTLPLEPVFLQRAFLKSWPALAKLVYTNPQNYTSTVTTTPWNPTLTSQSVPYDLLCDSQGLVEFDIILPLTTLPVSPVQRLNSTFFDCLRPFKGFGSLTTIDLASAQMTNYPQGLFAGLTRAKTFVYVDMQMLYAGVSAIPVGLFDDITGGIGMGPNGAPLTKQSKLNHAKNCGNVTAQVCETCVSGSYLNSLSTYSYCSTCTQGSFCINGINSPCREGTYQPLTGQSNCTSCPAGTFNDAEGQKQAYSCIGCSAGTYNPNSGSADQSDCLTCPGGSISSIAGSFSCNNCSAGTYSDNSHQVCLSCPVGTYNENKGASSLNQCLKCDPGSTSASGSTTPGACTELTCKPGQYYSGNETESWCHACEPGYYCSGNRKSACGTGTWSPGGKSSCTLCQYGTYNALTLQTNISACIPCPFGSYGDQLQLASCISCPDKTYSSATGLTSRDNCTVCASGAICPTGAAAAIILSDLLAASTTFISTNGTALMTRDDYQPIRGGASLRLTVLPDDATLLTANAGDVPIGSGSVSHSTFDPTSDVVDSSVMYGLLVGLVIAAGLSLLFYRFLPNQAVLMADQMALAHKLTEGGIMVKRPTQWGLAWTLAFVFIAIYVAIRLGTASNAQMINTLQPASSNSNTGGAKAAFQLTLRTYGATSGTATTTNALENWCDNVAAGGTHLTGFTGKYGANSSILGESCVILIDCLDCGISGEGSMQVKVPYVNQLIEYEVFVTAAIPDSWTRFYGVIPQFKTGELLDQSATLQFSAIEAYFLDQRSTSSIYYCPRSDTTLQVGFGGVTCSLPTSSSGTGFELAFNNYQQLTPQKPNALQADSTITLNFQFSKQDVVYQTTVSAKLGIFQVLASILATVVSLLSVFMLLFSLTERAMRKMKVSAGPAPVDIHVISQAEIDAEEEAARRQRDKIKHAIGEVIPGVGNDAIHQSPGVEMTDAQHRIHVEGADDKSDAAAASLAAAGVHQHGTAASVANDNGPTKNPNHSLSPEPVSPGQGRRSPNSPSIQMDVSNIITLTNQGQARRNSRGDSNAGGSAASEMARELAAMKAQQASERRQTQLMLESLQAQLKALQKGQQQQQHQQQPSQHFLHTPMQSPSVAETSAAEGLEPLSPSLYPHTPATPHTPQPSSAPLQHARLGGRAHSASATNHQIPSSSSDIRIDDVDEQGNQLASPRLPGSTMTSHSKAEL